MRPPVCRLCGRDFDPTEEGGLVSFRAGEEPWWKGRVDDEEVERHGPPSGHPPHVDWFCARHVEPARALSHLTKAEALNRLGDEGADGEGANGDVAPGDDEEPGDDEGAGSDEGAGGDGPKPGPSPSRRP